MSTMTKDERELAVSIQSNLNTAKRALRQARKDASQMMEIQSEAGRSEAFADAYRTKVALGVARSEVEKAHSVGTDAMCNCFEDAGDVIFAAGPGGGR